MPWRNKDLGDCEEKKKKKHKVIEGARNWQKEWREEERDLQEVERRKEEVGRRKENK
jgi:hypothetical protein